MSCFVAIPTSPSPPPPLSSTEITTLKSPCRLGAGTLRASPLSAMGLGRDELPPKSSSLSMNQVNSKRKRALLIEIPKENAKGILAMGDELRSDGRREVLEEGLGFAVCSKRGKKKHQMEDRHLSMPYINGAAKTVRLFLSSS